MASTLPYLKESMKIRGSDRFHVGGKFPYPVAPVHISKIMPHLEAQPVRSTDPWDLHRYQRDSKLESMLIQPYGGVVVFSSLLNMTNVSRLTIERHLLASPDERIVLDLDVKAPELSLKSMFPDPVCVDLAFVFTYRDPTLTVKPTLQYQPYWPDFDNQWHHRVPTYSIINSPKWKYVVVLSASSPKHKREAHFCSELNSNYQVGCELIKGKRVEDPKVYAVTIHTRDPKTLTSVDFGSQVSRLTVWEGGWQPTILCEVDRDYLKTFALQVHQLAPELEIYYEKKFVTPPELVDDLKRRSLEGAQAMYERIVQLHQQ